MIDLRMVDEHELKNAMNAFLESDDDTSKKLLETLAELNKVKKSVKDRFSKVSNDLSVCQKIFAGYDIKQQASNRAPLHMGASFFEGMCVFDAANVTKALDEEIARIEQQI